MAIDYFSLVSGILSSVVVRGGEPLFLEQIENARRKWGLPSNHHIERGTLRASVMATQACIQKIIQDGHSHFLQDTDPDDKFVDHQWGSPLVNGSDKQHLSALATLQKRLVELINIMKPHALEERSKSNKRKFQKAIEQARFSLPETLLEELAGKAISNINAPSQEVSQSVNIQLFAELEEEIVSKIIQWGGWANYRHDKIARKLRQELFGQDEIWVKSFALCFAAEIRSDTKLYRMAVFLRLERASDTLSEMMVDQQEATQLIDDFFRLAKSQFEDLTHYSENILGTLDKIASDAEQVLIQQKLQFAFNEKKVFYLPSIEAQDTHYSEIKQFHFAEEEDEFVGRENIFEQLDRQLLGIGEQVPKFLWAAICGEAGLGKSRLALQLLKEYSTTWRLSGFVRNGFIKNGDSAIDSLANITGPTLFVIDYADCLPRSCGLFIENCARLAELAPFPVRVIVLIRQTNSLFFRYIRDEQTDGAIALKSMVDLSDPSQQADEPKALVLSKLSDEDILTLINARVKRTAALKAQAFEPNEALDKNFLALLEHYEDKSPLFALMIADKYVREVGSAEFFENSLDKSKLELFWDYLQYQHNKHWLHALGRRCENDNDEDKIDRHLTFYILSTMCRGLTDEGWDALVNDSELYPFAKRILPHSKLIKEGYGEDPTLRLDESNVLLNLSGTIKNPEDNYYPILEPDLIGEALVLLALSEKGEEIAIKDGVSEYRKTYLPTFAWTIDPEGIAFFTLLLTQDYPEHAKRLSWLLPKVKREKDACIRSRLFRDLVSVTTEPFRHRAANFTDIDYIEALIDAFEADLFDPKAAHLEAAKGLADLAEELSFIINKSTIPKSVFNRKITLSDKRKPNSEYFRAAANLSDNHNGQEVSHIDIDKLTGSLSCEKTVARTLVLLRRLYDKSIELIFCENIEEDIKNNYTTVVAKVLGSVFWVHRDQNDKYGYANSPLCAEELETRMHLTERCYAKLENITQDEVSLSTICRLAQAVIYAEYGVDKSLGDKLYSVIRIKAESDIVCSQNFIVAAIRYIGNYTYTVMIPTYENNDLENSLDFSAILHTVNRLMNKAISLDSITEDNNKALISAYCEVANRFFHYDRFRKAPVDSYDRECYLLLMTFIEKHGIVHICQDVLVFFNFFLASSQAFESQSVIKQYACLVKDACFDRVSINRPGFQQLRTHLYRLACSPKENTDLVQDIVNAMIEQVGIRAFRELLDVLILGLPDLRVSPQVSAELARVVTDSDSGKVQEDKLEQMELVLTVSDLLHGENESLFNKMEKLWSTGTRTDEYLSRTKVFHSLQAAVWWYGLDHKKIRLWRKKLVQFFKSSQQVTSEQNSIVIEHNRAAISTISTFARLESAAGVDITVWLSLLEDRD